MQQRLQVRTHCPKWGCCPIWLDYPIHAALSTLSEESFNLTAADSTANIVVTIKLLQLILHVLDRGFSMALLLCHILNVNWILDIQQGFCEANYSARWKVQKCYSPNWNDHALEWFLLLATQLHHLARWLVELGNARIWQLHCPELIEPVDTGMLLEEDYYPVHPLSNITKIDRTNIIWHVNGCRGDAFHIHEGATGDSNRSIFQILSYILSLYIVSLSWEYHLLDV